MGLGRFVELVSYLCVRCNGNQRVRVQGAFTVMAAICKRSAELASQ